MEFYYAFHKLDLIPDYILKSPSTICIRPCYREDPATYTKICVDELDSLNSFKPLVFDFLLFVNPEPELRTFLALLGIEVTLETNAEYINVFNNVVSCGFSFVNVSDF